MATTEQTDLARRLQANDQLVLDELLRIFGNTVLALLRRQFRGVLREEDFEDVVSIGLFRVWVNRQRFDELQASLQVWFYRICENAARDVLKLGWQKARSLEVPSELAMAHVNSPADFDPAWSSPNPASETVACHAARPSVPEPSAVHLDLKEILAELPQVQRVILLADAAARDAIACSQRLGDELGIPASTVRVYRKRALDRVRREMTSKGYNSAGLRIGLNDCEDGVNP